MVLFSLINRFISLKASICGTSIEWGITMVLAFGLWATSLILNELSTEPKRVAVLVNGFFTQVSFWTKIVLNVMVRHIERIVKPLTMCWLVWVSVPTVIKLIVKRSIHVLRTDNTGMATVFWLLNHSVGGRELIILHSIYLIQNSGLQFMKNKFYIK